MNGTPVYLIAVFVEKVASEHSAFITVRLKKRRDLLGGILTAVLLFILLYGVLLAVLPVIALTIMGLPPDAGALALLGSSVAMKITDIAVQALFVTAAYCLTGQIIIGFVGLVVINLLCVAPSGFAKYLPFGMSSLLRSDLPQIGAESLPSVCAIGILLATGVLFTGWLCIAGYKRLPKN
jgi:hypothetical protein